MLTRATRGYGLLEGFLSKKRATLAEGFIHEHHRKGRILDIGCGSNPAFLQDLKFMEKHAIDQLPPPRNLHGIHWTQQDINLDSRLPFPGSYFSVITMLAVAEHIKPSSMSLLLSEIYRVLIPEGIVVLTTPAAWTDWLLRAMARLRFVSPEEIHEHCVAYTHGHLGWHFGRAGFSFDRVKFGTFEFSANLWVCAEK